MMIYLTGSSSSLVKSGGDFLQNDPMRSLGGFVSSSPVPNAAVNGIFDLISSLTLEKRQKEVVGICLINKFEFPVKNVTLKIIGDDTNLAEFRVAAVSVGPDLFMEKIANRYQEPIQAEFCSASFFRAGVNIKIEKPAAVGETFVLYPFDIMCEVSFEGLYGTYSAIDSALEDTEYTVKRLTDDTLRIERTDEAVVSVPEVCSFITDGELVLQFDGTYQNKADNTVALTNEDEPFLSGSAIGLWIQRIIKKSSNKTDETLFAEYKAKTINNTSEEVEFVLEYDLIETENFNKDYQQESYS